MPGVTQSITAESALTACSAHSSRMAGLRGLLLSVREWCGMMLQRNTARCTAATTAYILSQFCTHAYAAEPTPAVALKAFEAVDAWVHSWSELQGDQEGKAWYVDGKDITGARVELRLSNRVIGSGSALGLRAGGGASVKAATAAALAQAADRLDLPLGSSLGPVISDRIDEIQISLELAGSSATLLGETWDVAALAASPGLDGVRVTLRDESASMYPSEMISGHLSAVSSLRGLALRLGLAPESLATLRDREGLRLERFPVVWISQVSPDSFPTFLTRGGRLVAAHDVSEEALMAFARAASEHIRAKLWAEGSNAGIGRKPVGLLGTYFAGRDEYDPFIAPAREQAFSAYALGRFSQISSVDEASRRGAAVVGWRILDELLDVTESETAFDDDLGALACWLAAYTVLPDDAIPVDMRLDRLTEMAHTSALRLFTGLRDTPAASMSPAERSLVLFGLALGGEYVDDDAAVSSLVRLTASNMLADSDAGSVVGVMPWLALAVRSIDWEGRPAPGTGLFREMRDTVHRFVLRSDDVGMREADLEGGIVFTRGGPGLPTWQTLRAAVALGVLLTDDQVTPKDAFLNELGKMTRVIRYVMQLQITETEAHIFRVPRRSIGGVRVAVWEPRVTLDATGLGLLFAVELLEAIDAATP